MKLSLAALLSGMIAFSPAAHAALIVEDVPNLIQSLKNNLVQLQQAKIAADELITQGQQLQALAHNPSLGGALGLINQTGLANDLPVNMSAVQSLVSGGGGMSLNTLMAKAALLGNLAKTNFDRNHVYTCKDNSAACTATKANANAIAGMQGASQAVDQNMRNHLPVLQALRNRLLTAKTTKDVEDAAAQLQVEQVWTQNTISELEAIKISYDAQQLSQRQQADEQIDKSAKAFLDMANAQ